MTGPSQKLLFFTFNLELLLIFKLYSFEYIIMVIPIFSQLPPSTQQPLSLMQSPHHCSCPWVMCVSSLVTPFPRLYFTFPWLFCNYFLIPSPLHQSTHTPHLKCTNHQNALCICDSVSVILVLFVCFLDSIVDKYVFIAILLLLIFFS